MTELTNLPANAVVRRINDLIKRARSVKVCLFAHCASSFYPSVPELIIRFTLYVNAIKYNSYPRVAQVHAYIIHYLKKQMPYVIGRSEKQKRLVARLDKVAYHIMPPSVIDELSDNFDFLSPRSSWRARVGIIFRSEISQTWISIGRC